MCCQNLGIGNEIANGELVTTKRGTQAEKVEIHVFDDTADAILTLWGCICPSAAAWKPSYTVLLITQPDFKAERRPTLSLNDKTFVDIDPLMTDADWLRGYAQRLTKREHVNQPFPENSDAFPSFLAFGDC